MTAAKVVKMSVNTNNLSQHSNLDVLHLQRCNDSRRYNCDHMWLFFAKRCSLDLKRTQERKGKVQFDIDLRKLLAQILVLCNLNYITNPINVKQHTMRRV